MGENNFPKQVFQFLSGSPIKETLTTPLLLPAKALSNKVDQGNKNSYRMIILSLHFDNGNFFN